MGVSAIIGVGVYVELIKPKNEAIAEANICRSEKIELENKILILSDKNKNIEFETKWKEITKETKKNEEGVSSEINISDDNDSYTFVW
jgi:NADH:ubiquinone oxidoreductase subunit B-like Fe-S oxidoreductase